MNSFDVFFNKGFTVLVVKMKIWKKKKNVNKRLSCI